ncbi:MAG: hypothetical protein JWM19_4906 [Actinomycetia bacterium]|nr:hypothetical protein [Actinomycetes bacterium]
MASYFMLAHPERVAGLIQVAGPFLADAQAWHRRPRNRLGERGR